MTIPGYDPEDLDDALRARLEEGDPEELLSEEELRAYRNGEDLVDALETATIRRLLHGSKA
jgi:hypothetical protein